MKIPVNNQQLEIKFRFKSIDEWYKQFPDQKTNEDLFDVIFTGLVFNNPMALAKALYGGLAYLGKDMPAFDDFFDALSDYEATLTDTDKLFIDALAELNASGFFKLQLQAWKTQLETYKTASEKALSNLKAPRKMDSKQKEAYEAQQAQLEDVQERTQSVLNALTDKLSTIENG
ncbi:tail assembly chaperone [Loigolactobacillus coryniformis]|uniref:tail assembly chaperone n=1 Tax=Loigolactobacillus coryniformis TaxID=1610 RepID=UPI0002D94B41|nr:tail assembly chaperone [Loigolactobacillus coryniformis]